MSGRPFYLNIRHKISQLLNPALCLSCGIPVSSSDFICTDCMDAMERVPSPCELCGLPNPIDDAICPSCLHHPPLWQSMTAPLIYRDNTRKLIQALKFNEQVYIANALITHIYPYFNPHGVEALIPVPLHLNRLLERGFNQAEEIANALSSFLNIPVDRKSLTRIKSTESQAGLSLNKRQHNIIKAFQYRGVRPYKRVAIIDDIITSGSTMSEISKCLQKSGIRDIQVWSLARALKHD